jgi:transcriptional regulator with XRE-family HTH domain
MGWSLDDLVPIVGVTQKGVISNWEATNQRRRTPPITTLVILQRWYGVSLDYLVGHPDAERESPAVKAGRRLLRERLRMERGLSELDPSDRARRALQCAFEMESEAFFLGRAAACLSLAEEDLTELLSDGLWPEGLLERLAEFLGLDLSWFFAPDPVLALRATE